MKLVPRLMAGAVFGSSFLCAQEVSAQVGVSADYHIGYYVGAIHTLCRLYEEGLVSKTMTQDLSQFLKQGDDDTPRKATQEAFELLATDKSVKNCPLPR